MSEWCDVAWAYVLKQTPMMANPTEYRETLWTVLHDGELTPEMKKKSEEAKVEAAKRAVGKPVPKSAIDEMNEMMRRAAELRGELPPGETPNG